MTMKRLFDLVFSLTGLLLLSPVLLTIAILIKLDSKGPVFFRQERVGRFGQRFKIHKLRTMNVDAEAKGPLITTGNDCRITRIGRFLRKHKLDEIPQFIDVVMGTMSLVGPRPEVPSYVALYPEAMRKSILSLPPGITDFASIEFKDENEILNRFADPEQGYVENILPAKLAYYQRYINERSLRLDLLLILRTIKSLW